MNQNCIIVIGPFWKPNGPDSIRPRWAGKKLKSCGGLLLLGENVGACAYGLWRHIEVKCRHAILFFFLNKTPYC